MILKGCPNSNTIPPETPLNSSSVQDTIETAELKPVLLPIKLPDFIHRDSIRLNKNLAYRTTVDQLIYTLGKPDTILIDLNISNRFKKLKSKSDSIEIYQFKNSTFSSLNDKIEFNYIDFRNLRFTLSTGRHSINHKTSLEEFRTFYPAVTDQAFEGLDEISQKKVTQVHIPEFENSSSYWVISFLNNFLVGMRLIDK